MRNGVKYGTMSVQAVADVIRRRLPRGWSVALRLPVGGRRQLVLEAPDGRRAEFLVLSRKRVSPRDVPNLVRQAEGELLLVTPFLSPRSRELLVEAGMSYVDATGNLRVVASDPAIFLEDRGEDRDPDRRPRPLRSLKGAAAGRVVRALCDFVPPYGVLRLADIASTPLGTVSRVVSLLEEEALLIRDERKQIISVDWPALIARWVRDYSVRTSNGLHTYLEPRGLTALVAQLGRLDRYAITGSMARASVAPARLAMIYVEDAASGAQTLGLVPTEAGANVWLLEPYDEVVFDRPQSLSFGRGAQSATVIAAAPGQVAADLLTSPGRGPQEAQALLDKMKGDEDGWRHRPRT